MYVPSAANVYTSASTCMRTWPPCSYVSWEIKYVAFNFGCQNFCLVEFLLTYVYTASTYIN